ncbi:MAG: efflux RND transporter periplasmic adaptor subunit [bacterium]
MSSNAMRRVFLPLIILLASVAVFVGMIKMRPQPEKRRPEVPRPLVETVTLGHESEPIMIHEFGTLKAKRAITLVPQVGGEVVGKSPSFEPGARCAAGEVLLEIDDTDYVLAHEQARANLAQAEFELARAEEEARIARKEWERLQADDPGTPEPTPLVLHEPQLRLAAAAVASARAALVQARTNLDRCLVRAPFDGRIVTADVDQGQYLRPGTAVGSLHALATAEVTVQVADDDLAWISLAESGCPAGPNTTVDVLADFAGSVHRWEGRAVRLGGAVDPRSRLVPVVVEIDDPFTMQEGRPPLMDGMFVEIVFRAEAPEGAVVIPRAALRPGDQVWVVSPEQTLSIRTVEVARAGVHTAVVTSGLAPGDVVCTSNLQIVTEGLPVRMAGAPRPGGDPAGEPAPGGDR